MIIVSRDHREGDRAFHRAVVTSPTLPQLDIEQARSWRVEIVKQAQAMGAPPAVSPRDWPKVTS
jgi:hypothetical protein